MRQKPLGRSNPSVNSDDPLVANASSDRIHARAPEDSGEADGDQRHPHRREQDEGHRRVRGQDPIAGRIRPAGRQQRFEETPDGAEVDSREQRRHTSRGTTTVCNADANVHSTSAAPARPAATTSDDHRRTLSHPLVMITHDHSHRRTTAGSRAALTARRRPTCPCSSVSIGAPASAGSSTSPRSAACSPPSTTPHRSSRRFTPTARKQHEPSRATSPAGRRGQAAFSRRRWAPGLHRLPVLQRPGRTA